MCVKDLTVRKRCPQDHVAEGVVFWRVGAGVADGVDGGECRELEVFGEEVHHDVQGGARHDVDEQPFAMSACWKSQRTLLYR